MRFIPDASAPAGITVLCLIVIAATFFLGHALASRRNEIARLTEDRVMWMHAALRAHSARMGEKDSAEWKRHVRNSPPEVLRILIENDTRNAERDAERVQAFPMVRSLHKLATPEEIAAFEKSCTWAVGDARPTVFPLDYPEPADAKNRCFHCGKRTRSTSSFDVNPYNPKEMLAIPSHCMRDACIDALGDFAFPRHPVPNAPEHAS